MNFMESPYYLQELQDLEVLQRRVEEYYHVMRQVENDPEAVSYTHLRAHET